MLLHSGIRSPCSALSPVSVSLIFVQITKKIEGETLDLNNVQQLYHHFKWKCSNSLLYPSMLSILHSLASLPVDDEGYVVR
jgi:hypothetical protein